MMSGNRQRPIPGSGVKNPRTRAVVAMALLIFCLIALGCPLLADEPAPSTPPAAAGGDDIGQYLADHQADLAPFFQQNGEDILRAAVPVIMDIMVWVIICAMLVGWVLDILLSRGFAYFFAPAFAEWKRSIIYATGGLFLNAIYTGLLFLAIVISLKFASAGVPACIAVGLLLVVAFGAHLVWILYLYRTTFAVGALFYLVLVVIHSIAGLTLAKPIIGTRGARLAAEFVDQSITPKLQSEADAMKQQLFAASSDRSSAKAKVADLQNQIAQSQADAKALSDEIEEKKNSDNYLFSRIMQARARGDLDSARSQLAAFSSKFPSSPLTSLAQAQLTEIKDQIATEEAQKQQADAEAARAAAQAQAELLARAAKGEVTLSEMRRALIGKSRADVSNLLGLPTDTGSDRWGYRQQMIVNPLTNERHGLLVYFVEGIVQGVDYDRNGSP